MKTAVCLIIKNEQRYLDEWIDYHIGLGFDHIFIGEDIGSTSHLDIVKKYDCITLLNVGEYMDTEGLTPCSRQVAFYDKVYQDNKKYYDWMAFIDVDEFIVIENGGLCDFLNEYTDYEGVCLAWKYFGANGHIKRPEGNIVDNYTKVDMEEHPDCQVKTIVNCKKCPKILFMHASSYNCCDVFKALAFRRDLNGWRYAQPKYWHKAWINHYFTKSWEDWIDRMKRGNMQNNFRTLDTFFEYNEDMRDMEEELSMQALKIRGEFANSRIISRRYNIYNPEYVKELKKNFIKKHRH